MDRLDAMRAFVRTVELGTLSGAASDLRVKQSTVSRWIATLEEELGADLLERTTRRQRVTEAGHVFYDRAREILTSYDEVSATLGAQDPEPRGRLRVSLPVVFGRLHVMPHLGRFLLRYPSVELEVRCTDRYVNLVDDGIDVAVRVGVPVDSTLRGRTLASTPRVLVASPGYLSRRGEPRRAADLTEHECLLHTGLGARASWTLEGPDRSHRVRVQGRFAADNSDALGAVARSGGGIAMLAHWLVEDDLRRGRLVQVLPKLGLPPAPIQALTPPNRVVHPRVRAFVEYMGEVLGRTIGTQ